MCRLGWFLWQRVALHLCFPVAFQFDSGSGSAKYDVMPGEELEVSIYTRSVKGAKFTCSEASSKLAKPWVADVTVMHAGTGEDPEEIPTHKTITTTNIRGPASVKVKAESLGSRWSTENFLVVFSIYSV